MQLGRARFGFISSDLPRPSTTENVDRLATWPFQSCAHNDNIYGPNATLLRGPQWNGTPCLQVTEKVSACTATCLPAGWLTCWLIVWQKRREHVAPAMASIVGGSGQVRPVKSGLNCQRPRRRRRRRQSSSAQRFKNLPNSSELASRTSGHELILRAFWK